MQLDQWRVSDGYFNTSGQWVVTEESVRRRLHANISGTPAPTDSGDPGGPWGPALVPTWFVTSGDAANLLNPAMLVLEDGSELQAADALPPDLPLGSHRLVPDDGGPQTNLFVVPARQRRPERTWGWSSQLYATRSHNSWGHGDLGDLADLASWSSSIGAGLVAHNPLGSSLTLPNQEPSPYFGSSRRYLSVLYMNIEAVPGAALIGADLDGLARAGRELNQLRLIDRDRVYALKVRALEQIWAALTNAGGSRYQRVVTALGDDDVSLTRHAVFCALTEAHGSGWTGWPRRFSHPDSPAVEEFRRANADRVAFWRWVHLELDEQLAAASKSGTGLMGDLAVGFDPDGSDAWVDQDLLALDCRIGAPGDDFNPDGQDWGVTPYVPWRLRNTGYQPWIQTLRRIMRGCDGLRIDHVMGLSRLFWIPSDGGDPAPDREPGPKDQSTGRDSRRTDSAPGRAAGTRARGAYVYQFGTELLDVALMEAGKAGVWLAGEDLGTVEGEVRSAMATRGVFGYRVGWFEDSDPTSWPEETIGSLNTHDLATAAGVWTTGSQSPDGPVDDNDRLLLHRLTWLAGSELAGSEHVPGSSVQEVIVAAHATLAASGSAVVLASLDDSQAVVEQPNHPGTVDEFPNWRLALPVAIEDFDSTLAPRIAQEMAQNGRMNSAEPARPQ